MAGPGGIAAGKVGDKERAGPGQPAASSTAHASVSECSDPAGMLQDLGRPLDKQPLRARRGVSGPDPGSVTRGSWGQLLDFWEPHPLFEGWG